jgi:hypothetical protein
MVLFLFNLIIAIYLSFLTWLYGVWMVDDSQVAQLTATGGWAGIAFERTVYGLFEAALVGILLAMANRFILSRLFPARKRVSWPVAGSAGLAIALAAIISGIQFLIEKPYL